jgi:4-amino-4-deoxy-L-arabinose transferase-like glycosyltransferase
VPIGEFATGRDRRPYGFDPSATAHGGDTRGERLERLLSRTFGNSTVSARRFAAILAIIATAALAGRAVYVVLVAQDQTTSYDEVYYRGEASNIADGRGSELPHLAVLALGSGEHPPLTAVMLVPAEWLSDDNERALRLTVALAGVGVVVLIGLIGREVAGPRVGLVAAGVAAVYPNLWMNDGLLMPETFATLGTAAAILFTYRLFRNPAWMNAAGAGAGCAVAMLSRAELALLVPLLMVPTVLMIKGPTRARRVGLAAVFVITVGLAVAPWEAYLLSRYERPVFLSYGEGGVLAGANCEPTYSGPLIGFWVGLCKPNTKAHEASLVADEKRSAAVRYMSDHLDRLPLVMTARVARTWSFYRPFQMAKFSEAEGRPRWVSFAGLGTYWVLVSFAIAGAVVLRRRGFAVFPLLAPVAIVSFVAAALYGLVRFRVPAEVSIVVLGAVALDTAMARFDPDNTNLGSPNQTDPTTYGAPRSASSPQAERGAQIAGSGSMIDKQPEVGAVVRRQTVVLGHVLGHAAQHRDRPHQRHDGRRES